MDGSVQKRGAASVAQKVVVIGLAIGLGAALAACDDEEPAAAPASAASSPAASPDEAETSATPEDDAYPMIRAQDLPRGDVLPGGESARFGETLPVTHSELDEAYAGIRVACGPKPTKGLPEPTAASQSTVTRAFTPGGKKYLFDLLFLEFADPAPIEQLRDGLNSCFTRGGAAYGAYPDGNRVMITSLPIDH